MLEFDAKTAVLPETGVFVSWDAPIGELLAALRERYPGLEFLGEEAFDGLAKMYEEEDLKTMQGALGQQCTVYGWLLFNLVGAGEGLCLVPVPAAFRKPFENAAMLRRQKFERWMMPRMKAGAPPPEIKRPPQLPVESWELPHGPLLELHGKWGFNQHIKQGGFNREASLLDFGTWPPEATELHHTLGTLALHRSGELWAGIFCDDRNRHERRPATVRMSVFAGAQPEDWIELLGEGVAERTDQLYWFGDDLIVAGPERVWRIKDAGKHKTKAKVILQVPQKLPGGPTQPSMAQTGDGRYFLFVHGYAYEYVHHKLKRLEGEYLAKSVLGAIPTGASNIMYMDRDRAIIHCDMRTMDRRVSKLPHSDYLSYTVHLRDLGEEWVWVESPGEQQRGKDLGALWNLKTGDWLRIPWGTLGKRGLEGMWKIDEDRFLLRHGAELMRADNVLGFLKKLPENGW